jgi:hypothetical protein
MSRLRLALEQVAPAPYIRDLSGIVSADGWMWDRAIGGLTAREKFASGFWIGTDLIGQRWLVKMTGSACAYRERTFAALAQRLGFSCQSSAFLKLSPDSPPLTDPSLKFERPTQNQLAIWMYDEHQALQCDPNCGYWRFRTPWRNLVETPDEPRVDPTELLLSFWDLNVADWARGEVLGYLCGQFEPGGRLWTRDHKMILIDNELMWSSEPENLWTCRWLVRERHVSEAGVALASQVCKQLCSISNEELDWIANPPRLGFLDQPGSNHKDLRGNIRAAKWAASQFLDAL